MRMKKTARIISTYAGDTSGVCSALFELGGMTVMHDPSGCNSTYNTHDEPRWYDFDSMIYISALSETEAILGDDSKLIRDVTDAATALRPKFITLCGTPVPMMIGTDLPAIASVIQRETGIPAFGLPTNGMHSYLSGASMALKTLLERFCPKDIPKTPRPSSNLLGITPLDFSINGSVASIKAWLEDIGFPPVSCAAMGSSLEDLQNAGAASVNLVVSWCGLAPARALQARFGTPYVVGVPVGRAFSQLLARALRRAAETGESSFPCAGRQDPGPHSLALIGESVFSGSLARSLALERGLAARVLCPLETESACLAPGDRIAPDEDDLIPLLSEASGVVADPLYQPICPQGRPFCALPHEAFSGRMFRSDIPNLINTPLTREILC